MKKINYESVKLIEIKLNGSFPKAFNNTKKIGL